MLATSMMPTRTLVIPRPPSLQQKEMSSLSSLTGPRLFNFSPLSTITLEFARSLNLTIRMGGGPRTFPGGVSKWQWKRMQAKKSKQLLKARLLRERQIYEMRKRTELKAAISELERPWEMVEKAPKLFSVKADEQVKVLADRFQKPGGFDMWSERDGPQVFKTPDGLPSARFFPKDAVHSVKPYGMVVDTSVSARSTTSTNNEASDFSDWTTRRNSGKKWRQKKLIADENESSTSLVYDTQRVAAKKGVDVHLSPHRGGYETSKGKTLSDELSSRSSSYSQRSPRTMTRQGAKWNSSEHSTSTFDDRRFINASKGKTLSVELSSRSSSYNQRSPRTMTRQGAKWNSSEHSTSSFDDRQFINASKGKPLSDEPSNRSRSYNHTTPRTVTRQGAKWNLRDESTNFVHHTRLIAASKGKTLSDEPSSRSSSFNQRTPRTMARQGAKWNSREQSNRNAQSVEDYKPRSFVQSRRKLDLRLPYASDSEYDSDVVSGSMYNS